MREKTLSYWRKTLLMHCRELRIRCCCRYRTKCVFRISEVPAEIWVEVNEDDIEELIMGHEDELTIEELQEILNEEHQETQ
ncbi:hypothetical protein TNCV_1630971 [Trichonephila clavipes]|nr:hypothetical protein TNCV_1630971 [Trichonephila clavipes]